MGVLLGGVAAAAAERAMCGRGSWPMSTSAWMGEQERPMMDNVHAWEESARDDAAEVGVSRGRAWNRDIWRKDLSLRRNRRHGAVGPRRQVIIRIPPSSCGGVGRLFARRGEVVC